MRIITKFDTIYENRFTVFKLLRVSLVSKNISYTVRNSNSLINCNSDFQKKYLWLCLFLGFSWKIKYGAK